MICLVKGKLMVKKISLFWNVLSLLSLSWRRRRRKGRTAWYAVALASHAAVALASLSPAFSSQFFPPESSSNRKWGQGPRARMVHSALAWTGSSSQPGQKLYNNWKNKCLILGGGGGGGGGRMERTEETGLTYEKGKKGLEGELKKKEDLWGGRRRMRQERTQTE